MAKQNRFIDQGGTDTLQFYDITALPDERSRKALDRLERQRQQLDASRRSRA